MIDKLVEALRGLKPPPTADEIQDALWLAERWGTRPAEEPPPRAAKSSAAPPREPPGPLSPTGTDPAPPPEQDDVQSQDTAEAALFLAERADITSPQAIRAPAPPALPRTLALSRALRPLRVKIDSATSTELDEERTARQIAETGIWQPLMSPSPERLFDLALVVDTGASMRVWQRTVTEFQALLERLGAFRDVRIWRMDTDEDRPLSPTPGSGSGRSPDQLIDPTGRRIVLVVSDCTGRAWQDGRAAALLDRWGGNGPVAIVQTLPERLWWRCAVEVEQVSFTTFTPGAPNTLLKAGLRDNDADAPPGVVIPVLALEPRWLGPWASMVAYGGRDVFGAAVFTEQSRPEVRAQPEPANLTAHERVARFRAASSPNAYKLAGYLAAAPLRLPVIRLVQQAMLPKSTPADLAEIYLGELLRLAPQSPDASPHEITYEFHDGVREVLLSGLRRGDAMRVLRNVWSVVRDRFGSSLDFPALLAEIERDGSGMPPDQAFAQVTAQVLERLGGRYAAISRSINGARKDPPSHRAGTASGRTEERRFGPLPPRNPYFTGRDVLLRSLHDSLASGVTVLLPPSLHGLGGEGKSQLAVEYAYRFEEEYDLICWIPADQLTVARATLADLAKQLGIPQSDSITGIAENLHHALRTNRNHPRWLFIFDNARDPKELLPLLPRPEDPSSEETSSPSWNVLVTSRDRRWENLATTIDVDVFERAESIRYLLRRVPQLSPGEADQLADRVGDLPLAVEQAAAWQTTTGRTAGEYLELFDQRLRSVPDHLLPVNFPAHLAASLSLGLERLNEENPRARGLFDLWAFFSPEPVAARLLFLGREAELPAQLSGLVSDEALLRETMRTIGRFELARFDPEGETLQVHRLVRTMLKARISERDRAGVRGQVHALLAAATPQTEADDETTWTQRSLITPHVLASGIIDAATAEARRVALDQAQYLVLAGDFAGARLIADFALKRWRDAYGPDDDLALDAARMLANALRGLGDITSAAALSKETLERAERKYEADNLTTLFTALGYGADLKYLGAFQDAYDLDRRTWQRMEQRFGRDSAENTLFAASNVALGLRLLGRFHEAYEIDKGSLDSLRERSDPRYRDIFRVTHHMARDLHGLGRYADALARQAASLRDLDPVLSPDHTLVLQAQMSHAETLRASGRHAEAERLATSTFESHIRRFGRENPNTLASKVCLAMTLLAVGSPEDAKRLQQEAWTELRRALHENHPFVHACAGGLAIIMRAVGDVQTALDIDQQALDGLRTGPLGPDHYYSLYLSLGLSTDLYLFGELETAQSVCAQTLVRLRDRLGAEHPVTLACEHNDLVIRAASGLPSKSSRDPLDRLGKVLGKHHPDVRAGRRGDPLECVIAPMPL